VTQSDAAPTAPFGSLFARQMVTSQSAGGVFRELRTGPVAPLSLHPAAHALHYGSACFEGIKAHRGFDGQVRIFRGADHAARLQQSAEVLHLPVPEPGMLRDALRESVRANLDEVPPAPGALYLRPTLLGTDANIGSAASPSRDALFYVLASPVGDYFDSSRTLTVKVEIEIPRSTPQFGRVKAGANYVQALGPTLQARAEGADQVLFAPGGDIQETGASNFVLIDDNRIVTKALAPSFLHGVTRASILTLAADLGYDVEERDITVDELLQWIERGEAALSGTAAVLSSVGAFLYNGEKLQVRDGAPGPNTLRLREALIAVQRGEAPDKWGWTEVVTA
jgi:branched-chain amino acid aminotransferase